MTKAMATTPPRWRGALWVGLAVAIALFAFLGLAQILMTGGLVAWLADHKDLAPWFSGTATSTGVIVALWNASRTRKDAFDKEGRELERQAKNAAKAQRALVETALGTIALAEKNIDFIRDALADKTQLTQRLDAEVMRVGLRLAQLSFTRFPIHMIGNADAVRAYFAAEFAHNMLVEVAGLRERHLSTGIEDDWYGVKTAVETFDTALTRFKIATIVQAAEGAEATAVGTKSKDQA